MKAIGLFQRSNASHNVEVAYHMLLILLSIMLASKIKLCYLRSYTVCGRMLCPFKIDTTGELTN